MCPVGDVVSDFTDFTVITVPTFRVQIRFHVFCMTQSNFFSSTYLETVRVTKSTNENTFCFGSFFSLPLFNLKTLRFYSLTYLRNKSFVLGYCLFQFFDLETFRLHIK